MARRRVTAIEGTESCGACNMKTTAAWAIVAMIVGYVFVSTVTMKPKRKAA